MLPCRSVVANTVMDAVSALAMAHKPLSRKRRERNTFQYNLIGCLRIPAQFKFSVLEEPIAMIRFECSEPQLSTVISDVSAWHPRKTFSFSVILGTIRSNFVLMWVK